MYKVSESLIPPRMSPEERKCKSESLRSYKPVDDAVLYALALLPGEKFTLLNEKIHTSFHELKKKNPEYFSELMFDTSGIFPYSEKLDQVFFWFGQSGILEWSLSPQFYYFKKEKKETVLNHLSGKFSDKEKKELSEISRELQGLLLKDRLV